MPIILEGLLCYRLLSFTVEFHMNMGAVYLAFFPSTQYHGYQRFAFVF